MVFIFFTQCTHNNIDNLDKAIRLSGPWASLCIHYWIPMWTFYQLKLLPRSQAYTNRAVVSMLFTMSCDFSGREPLDFLLTVLVTSGPGFVFVPVTQYVLPASDVLLSASNKILESKPLFQDRYHLFWSVSPMFGHLYITVDLWPQETHP